MSVNPQLYLYEYGSGLEVPGIEAVLEYGDASTFAHGGIPGALRINDRSMPDQVRVTELSGLHDDPDVGDSRTERAGHWGERSGLLVPRGRTLGVTGHVRSGNVPRMRDLWRRTRAQFGRAEKDLVIHPPNEVPLYVNQVWSDSIKSWSTTGGPLSGFGTFTDGTITGIQLTATPATPAVGSFSILGVSLSDMMVPWNGEDIWITALVKAQAAAATMTSIGFGLVFVQYDPMNGVISNLTTLPMTGTAIVNTPTTGTYYQLTGRLDPTVTVTPLANYVMPSVVATYPATAGAYTLRAARLGMVLLNQGDLSPSGYFNGSSPGFEYDGAPPARSYGPCYVANQVRDVDTTDATAWANDSTSGVTVAAAGTVRHSWPEVDSTATQWTITNPNTTSRTLAVRTPATLTDAGGLFVVSAGRSYRAHARLRVDESFATGALQIVWLDKALAAISTSSVDTFDPVAAGLAQDVELDGVVTAPTFAMRAYMRIANTSPSTTAGNKLSILIAEPRFFDVSEHDAGNVAIDGTMAPEHGVSIYTPALSGPALLLAPNGARRRIPRPFLLRKVRSLWDGKAPESQRNLQARRDFTMSLRAADPRIYVLDERHALLRMSGSPTLVIANMSDYGVVLNAAPSQVASDDFTGTTAGGALNGRTAPLGGTWATSGDATDFTFTDTPQEGVERFTTTFTNGRIALLGTTAYVDTDASALVSSITSDLDSNIGLLTRYVDASNYVRADLKVSGALLGGAFLTVSIVVAGSATVLDGGVFSHTSGTLYTLRVIATSGGGMLATLSSGATVVSSVSTVDARLATGGALASGKVGLRDAASGTTTRRFYDSVSIKTPPNKTLAPTGFTYYNTSLEQTVIWRTSSLSAPFPRGGITLGWDEAFPPASGYLAADSLARMYYSAGSTTYLTPQVVVAGNVINGVGHSYDLFAGSLTGTTWQYNTLGAVLKRVSSSTWIEARFNSANNAAMNAAHPTPAAPFSLELWCSHDDSGTPGDTRLNAWDAPVGDVASTSLKHLRTYMDAGGVVYVELWSKDPNLADDGLIARKTYTLTSNLLTLLGPTVAGRAGALVKLARWYDGTTGINVATMQANYDTPYISSFNASEYVTTLVDCPVIGDADDVPLQLQLRGNIDSPTIVGINTSTGESAALRLSGVFPESDPVTVDMDTGTIMSASGVNYFDRRARGSRFFSLSPGQNVISVQAVNWDVNAAAHVIATWRDALH